VFLNVKAFSMIGTECAASQYFKGEPFYSFNENLPVPFN